MKPTDGSFDATLTPEQVADSDTRLSDQVIHPSEPGDRSLPPSYQVGALLGRGGMGEVVTAEEVEIGRNVAIKRMRGDHASPELVARFLREARIQARLDHPAIVPVHTIGHDSAGRPYFTMKRLTGRTLSEILADEQTTQQRLLRSFGDVCSAIEFTHAKGFLHRDLKPANVMLGDYGEVYVLDWGLARAIAETDAPAASGVSSLGGETQLGAVMGTPGYMSPEQLRGETVGPPTDVYALGSILFEILTGQPLHPKGQPAVAATLAGGVLSPAKRTPDRNIAPELDEVCTEALAEDPAKRPTAKVLADKIQGYLDGDRDLEQRRARADKLLATARADLESGDPARRASAMQGAGRALALDPASADAAALVSTLMLEPPKVLPDTLAEQLERIDGGHVHMQARLAITSLASYFLFFPILVWMGIRDWGTLVVLFVVISLSIGVAILLVRGRHIPLGVAMALNATVIVVMSQVTSPFVLLPGIMAGSAVSFTTLPQFLHRPALVVGTFAAAFLLPVVLEAAGVMPSTYDVRDGSLIAQPTAVGLDGVSAYAFLIVGSLAVLIVLTQFVRMLAIAQRTSRRQLEIQAWHLAHLVKPLRDA